MYRSFVRPTVVFGLCGIAAPTFAQSDAPVVVVATRTPQLAEATLAPVIVITREEISRSQTTDVADLLRTHAGLDVARNGGPGQAASLFIRGTESNHVLVMIDGVKVNPGTIGGAALQNVDPELIERIEIVKGPRSTLYGSEAIGGVINIITRQATRGTEVSAFAGVGPDEMTHAGAGAHYAGAMRAGIDIAHQQTDGFPARVDSDVKSGYDNFSVNAYAGRRFGAMDAEVRHWQSSGNSEYLDFFATPVDQDYVNRVTQFSFDIDASDKWTSRLRIAQAVDEIDQNQSTDFAHTRRNSIDWQNDVQLTPAHLATAGVYISDEHTDAQVFGSGFDEDTSTWAVYAQDDMHLDRHRLLIAARYTDHDAFGGHTTANLEYGYEFTPDTRVTASYGTAFRAPDATDRFGFGGDPELDPEKSRNAELGLHHRVSASQTVAVNAFDNRIKDLIEYDLGANQMMNIGRARIRGVEASYEYSANPWRARVEAIAQDPEDETTGEQLARRAARSLTASFDYDAGRWQAGADWLLASRRKDTAFSDTFNPGYGLVNLTAQYRLAKQWSLQGRIENLFDQDYTLADGYRTAGRGAYVTVRYGTRI